MTANATLARYGTVLRIWDNGGKTADRYTTVSYTHLGEAGRLTRTRADPRANRRRRVPRHMPAMP